MPGFSKSIINIQTIKRTAADMHVKAKARNWSSKKDKGKTCLPTSLSSRTSEHLARSSILTIHVLFHLNPPAQQHGNLGGKPSEDEGTSQAHLCQGTLIEFSCVHSIQRCKDLALLELTACTERQDRRLERHVTDSYCP